MPSLSQALWLKELLLGEETAARSVPRAPMPASCVCSCARTCRMLCTQQVLQVVLRLARHVGALEAGAEVLYSKGDRSASKAGVTSVLLRKLLGRMLRMFVAAQEREVRRCCVMAGCVNSRATCRRRWICPRCCPLAQHSSASRARRQLWPPTRRISWR